jgi:hypothetical protein
MPLAESVRSRINRGSYSLLLYIRCFAASFVPEDTVLAAALCQFLDSKPTLIKRNAFARTRQKGGGTAFRCVQQNNLSEFPVGNSGENSKLKFRNPTYVNCFDVLLPIVSCQLSSGTSNDGGPRHMKMKASMAPCFQKEPA